MPISQRQRTAEEERWSAELASILSDQYDSLAEQLNPQFPNNPPNDWWEKWRTEIAAFLGISLLQLSQLSAEDAVATYGIGVDWDAILNASQEWVSGYNFELVRGINATSEAALQGLLNDYYAGRIDYDTMLGMLETRFGPTRAASIATTEVTRAYEQGIDMYQQELDGLGLDTDRVWITEAGACPYCEPYDGVLESEGWDDGPPPLHVSCRCSSEIVLLPGSKHYQEWNEKVELVYANSHI